jgi:pyruvate dehydrogenase E2 component (dihydrolipoamide acetyltransferase)
LIEFKLPSLGSDMDEGTLVEWRVRPGDAVKKGQIVAVVDTTKAAIDVECWDEGVVHVLLVEPGTKLPVGAPMAVLRAVGESESDAARAWAALVEQRQAMKSQAAAPAALLAPLPAAAMPGGVPGVAPRAIAPAAVAPRASPAARRLAEQHGIDLATVAAPSGVISLEDVQAPLQVRAAAAPAAAVAPTVAAPTAAARSQAIRSTIAAAMSRAKREIPHYYLAEEIEFEAAAAWLAQRNANLPATQRLLPAALLLKAVAFALHRYPEFSGFWRDGAFVPGNGIHLGVAISLREGGLVAPALHDVDRLDIATLTHALLDLVKRTRVGALRSSEFSDPTITVTNLGDQGVASVFGVIYPPQVALVGFGRIGLRAVVGEDGALRAAPMLTVTLAADHRASDGHRGALLLAAIREQVRDPESLDRPWGGPQPQAPPMPQPSPQDKDNHDP